ncbi:MAG: ABC transporter substrate-binding protein [Candidatus Woesearchaeota archaeon]
MKKIKNLNKYRIRFNHFIKSSQVIKSYKIRDIIKIINILIVLFLIISCTQFYSEKSKINEIKKRGKLIIGTSPPYGIMEFYKNNEIVGLDIDIAKEIAKSLNVELEIKIIDFDKFSEALNNDEIDLMIASITITSDRLDEMELSIPYFNTGQVIVSKYNINRYEELENKTILIEEDGSDTKNQIFKIIKNFTPIYYSESQGLPYVEKAIFELNQNKVDAFVIDYIAAIDIVKYHKDFHILGPFTNEFYGIASKKGNKDLINHVNQIIRNLKYTGELDKIKEKWI